MEKARENTTKVTAGLSSARLTGRTPREQVIRYTIEGNAFLYRMVRRVVGALVRVGRGDVSLEEFAAVFEAAQGDWPNQTAPPHGLCLIEVIY